MKNRGVQKLPLVAGNRGQTVVNNQNQETGEFIELTPQIKGLSFQNNKQNQLTQLIQQTKSKIGLSLITSLENFRYPSWNG